ncbi:hypothetical protein MKX03_037126 [Papaver bracteatum]|nr:hypothetical protein MKX03_037126 [Papaver bracteatum]
MSSSSSSSSVKTNLTSTNPIPKGLDDESKLASLPSGFKFKPTDAISINFYLGRIFLGKALPANRMKNLTQDYKGYGPNHWYLFTQKCYGEKTCRPCFWLSTTPRTSVYLSGNSTNSIGCKDNWVYHEVIGSKSYRTQYKNNKTDEWILCRFNKLQ